MESDEETGRREFFVELPWRTAMLELRDPVRNWSTSTKEDTFTLRIAISSDPQILDGDNVQGVDGHDFTIAVNHSKGAGRDQDHLRMADGRFAAVRGAQRKR